MKRYLVSSGDLFTIVNAVGVDDACDKAIREATEEEVQPDLGRIMSCIEVVGDEWFVSTETVCRRVGAWARV